MARLCSLRGLRVAADLHLEDLKARAEARKEQVVEDLTAVRLAVVCSSNRGDRARALSAHPAAAAAEHRMSAQCRLTRQQARGGACTERADAIKASAQAGRRVDAVAGSGAWLETLEEGEEGDDTQTQPHGGACDHPDKGTLLVADE